MRDFRKIPYDVCALLSYAKYFNIPKGSHRMFLESFAGKLLFPSRKVLVTQVCPTLSDPMDGSPPDSSVHGTSQARKLEWVAISFSRGIFPTQGRNLGLLHYRQILYRVSPKQADRPPICCFGGGWPGC